MLDEFWRDVFGTNGVETDRHWSRTSPRVQADDVAEVVAAAHGGDPEDYEEWGDAVFRLKDGRFMYVFLRQCDTCGSGGPVAYVKANLADLIRMKIGEAARKTLGLSI